jgi:hypothetical protein
VNSTELSPGLFPVADFGINITNLQFILFTETVMDCKWTKNPHFWTL